MGEGSGFNLQLAIRAFLLYYVLRKTHKARLERGGICWEWAEGVNVLNYKKTHSLISNPTHVRGS